MIGYTAAFFASRSMSFKAVYWWSFVAFLILPVWHECLSLHDFVILHVNCARLCPLSAYYCMQCMLFGKINQQIVPVYVEMEHAMSNWLRFTWGQRPSQWRTWRIVGCNASPDNLIYSTVTTAQSNRQSPVLTIYSTFIAQIHCFAFTAYHFVRHGGWTMNTRQLSSICGLTVGGLFIYRRVLPALFFNYYFLLQEMASFHTLNIAWLF